DANAPRRRRSHNRARATLGGAPTAPNTRRNPIELREADMSALTPLPESPEGRASARRGNSPIDDARHRPLPQDPSISSRNERERSRSRDSTRRTRPTTPIDFQSNLAPTVNIRRAKYPSSVRPPVESPLQLHSQEWASRTAREGLNASPIGKYGPE